MAAHALGTDTEPRTGGRRDFIANLVVSLASSVGLSGIAVRFAQYLYPVIPPAQVRDVPVGPRGLVAPNGGIVRALPEGHVVLVDTDGKLRAFSAICTHLGCVVKWQPTEHHAIYCECHGGMFGRDGQVVGGPPPRPLPEYPVEERDGQVFVKMTVRPPAVSA